MPSEVGYAAALSTALKREKDIARAATKYAEKNVVASSVDDTDSSTSASELDLLKNGRPQFGSDTEDDESEYVIFSVLHSSWIKNKANIPP